MMSSAGGLSSPSPSRGINLTKQNEFPATQHNKSAQLSNSGLEESSQMMQTFVGGQEGRDKIKLGQPNQLHSVTLMPQPTKWIEIGGNSVDESQEPMDDDEYGDQSQNQDGDGSGDNMAVFAQESSLEEGTGEG